MNHPYVMYELKRTWRPPRDPIIRGDQTRQSVSPTNPGFQNKIKMGKNPCTVLETFNVYKSYEYMVIPSDSIIRDIYKKI